VDAGTEVIQWNGSASGALERSKGATLTQAIESERDGHASNRVVDEGHEDEDFWKHIGGKGAVAPASAGGSDVEYEAKHKGDRVLYRLSDASGKLEFKQIAKGADVKKGLLDSSDVFILDTGAEVFAWVGKNASTVEKKKALGIAQDYITQHGLPQTTPVVRIIEGGANETFEDSFH